MSTARREPRAVSTARRHRWPRRWIVLLAAVMMLAACSGSSDSGSAQSEQAAQREQPGGGPNIAEAQTLQGVIAVEDQGVIRVLDPIGSQAENMAGIRGDFASQPVWSPDGSRLAWVSENRSVVEIRTAIPRLGAEGDQQVDPDAEGAARVSRSAVASAPRYLSWSSDGALLGFHREIASEQTVELGTLRPGAEPASVVQSSDIHSAWNPERNDLAVRLDHRDQPAAPDDPDVTAEEPDQPGATNPDHLAPNPGAGSDTANGTSSVIVVAGDGNGEPRLERDSASSFGSPLWLNATTVLIIEDEEVSIVELPAVNDGGVDGDPDAVVPNEPQRWPTIRITGVTHLVLSPDRSRLAYVTTSGGAQTTQAIDEESPDHQSSTESDAERDPQLRIFDFGRGQDRQVIPFAPTAFEWSPDGQYLSWLGPAIIGDGLLADDGRYQWRIVGFGGPVRSLDPFIPTERDLTHYLPNFDQYALSHNRWEPMGLAMVFAGTIGDQQGVWVQTIDGTDGATFIGAGEYAVWNRIQQSDGGARSFL